MKTAKYLPSQNNPLKEKENAERILTLDYKRLNIIASGIWKFYYI
jgi:hypothetical protein